jgi:hypothetical protein
MRTRPCCRARDARCTSPRIACASPAYDTEPRAGAAAALPQVVSLWANGLGAFLTLLADRLK